MWTEKYRPKTLDKVVGQGRVCTAINKLLESSEMPHMLFSGSAGVGKTTAAWCVSRQVLGNARNSATLELNASDERGIEIVRDRIKQFTEHDGMFDVKFKIVILDEADEMTNTAQSALRRIMEDSAAKCRFVLIANEISRLIDPIKSRCAIFKFNAVEKQAVIRRLKDIAIKEDISITTGGLNEIYAYTNGDMRQSLNLLQSACAKRTLVDSDDILELMAGYIEPYADRMVRLSLDKDLEAALEKLRLLRNRGIHPDILLYYITNSVVKQNLGDAKIGKILIDIANCDWRLNEFANIDIQFTGLLAGLTRIK